MKAVEINVWMSLFSLYVISYIGSKGIHHVGKAIEEGFNQLSYT